MPSKEQQADLQVATGNTRDLYEVLVESPTGQRTVRRLRAKDRTAAEKQVSADVDAGKVLGTAVAGAGLGSGDAA